MNQFLKIKLFLENSPSPQLSVLNYAQCDQIGRFLQVLATNCLSKVPKILFGLFLIMSVICKKYVASFWAIFEGN